MQSAPKPLWEDRAIDVAVWKSDDVAAVVETLPDLADVPPFCEGAPKLADQAEMSLLTQRNKVFQACHYSSSASIQAVGVVETARPPGLHGGPWRK